MQEERRLTVAVSKDENVTAEVHEVRSPGIEDEWQPNSLALAERIPVESSRTEEHIRVAT